jgi:hypothetical protein
MQNANCLFEVFLMMGQSRGLLAPPPKLLCVLLTSEYESRNTHDILIILLLGTCWGHFENPLESLRLNLMGILCELFGNLVGTLWKHQHFKKIKTFRNHWVQSQSDEPTVLKDSRIAILFVVIFIFSYKGFLG